MDENSEICWHAPIHLGGERTNDWYWGIGLAAIVGIGLSIFWGNVLFAIIIALAALSLGILGTRKPRECEIILSEEGITIDHELHPFRSLRTFWLFEEHPAGPRLLLTTAGMLHPHISIAIHEPATVAEVRTIMEKHLAEEEHHSPGAILIELLGL